MGVTETEARDKIIKTDSPPARFIYTTSPYRDDSLRDGDYFNLYHGNL